MQTRHGVLGDTSWTRGKVSKAQMRLVTSRCCRIRAPKLEHAAWQDGARTPIGTSRACRVARWQRRLPFVGTAHAPAASRPAPVRSTAQELKIRCVPAGFSQGPVCESRPSLYTRPGQIWVLGSAGGSTGSKDVVQPRREQGESEAPWLDSG